MSDAKVEASGEGSCCYYSVLGVSKQATASQIRGSYHRLALKWHPDRWMKDPKVAGEAKKRFQKVQEAYSVLSDKRKRSIYDAGLFGFLGDDDDEGFCDFLHEMAVLMKKERSQEKNSSEDLKGLISDMLAENERAMFGFEWNACPSSRKRIRTGS